MGRISRNTKQKELIKNELKSFKSFFAAEDLYKKVKNKDEKIGIATVYRMLNELSKGEKLHSYLCGNKTVYSTGSRNHFHFICEKCSKVSHIEVKNIDFIKKKIKRNICHMQIDIYGVCDNCAKIKAS